jgi:hypothetical protein
MCREITCRLAIQVCIGYSLSGTARHRTFSIKGINPDVDLSKVAAFVRDCIAPILAFPITKVRLVKKVPIPLDEPEETTDVPDAEPCRDRSAAVRRPVLHAVSRFLFGCVTQLVADLAQFMKRGPLCTDALALSEGCCCCRIKECTDKTAKARTNEITIAGSQVAGEPVFS